jgi:hypothetical protein
MSSKSGYDALMHEICVGLGFCGCIKGGRPLHIDRFIPSKGPVTADQFVEWVFLADDMNPNAEPKRWSDLKEKVKLAFVRYMGSEIVDAELLRWSDSGQYQPRQVHDPLYRKFEVWRRLSSESARRYNCIQHLQTGEYRVLTVDLVFPGREADHAQAQYFVDAFLTCDRSDPAPQSWFGSLESAIADHDAGFEG